MGGNFTTAGSVPAENIAQWDGNNWSALGLGLNGGVNTLALSGNNLFVGGSFTVATNSGPAPVAASRIAQWNGNAWSALGGGVNNSVSALAISGTNLYAGGSFTVATNSGPTAVAASHIAQWDGNNWSAMGSGVNNSVYALAVSGSSLFAGGAFTTAGTNVSAYATWAILGPPFIIANNADFGFTGGHSQFGFDVSGGAAQTLVVQASTNLLNWVPLQTNLLGGPLWYFSDPQAGNFPYRFYRLKSP